MSNTDFLLIFSCVNLFQILAINSRTFFDSPICSAGRIFCLYGNSMFICLRPSYSEILFLLFMINFIWPITSDDYCNCTTLTGEAMQGKYLGNPGCLSSAISCEKQFLWSLNEASQCCTGCKSMLCPEKSHITRKLTVKVSWVNTRLNTLFLAAKTQLNKS